MPELRTDDTTLHYEVEGSGEPVTVFAHGLTNSCMELAAFTPFAPGTKVRFCFRGHGHSGVPEAGSYRFADFARDLDEVARATGATNVVGTSLGAGAVLHLVGREPARFDRIVLLLPATLDLPIGDHSLFDRTVDVLETLPRDQAIEAILRESGRAETIETTPVCARTTCCSGARRIWWEWRARSARSRATSRSRIASVCGRWWCPP